MLFIRFQNNVDSRSPYDPLPYPHPPTLTLPAYLKRAAQVLSGTIRFVSRFDKMGAVKRLGGILPSEPNCTFGGSNDPVFRLWLSVMLASSNNIPVPSS